AVYQAASSRRLIPAAFAPLLLIESLRTYIFFGLNLIIPAAVVVATRGTPRDRILSSVVAVAIAAALLGAHFSGRGAVLPSALLDLEARRLAMGVGARTSFVDPIVQVQPGLTYVVAPGPSVSPLS